MSLIRCIVVGAGIIGPRHAESVLKRDDCSLFAIVDRSANGPSVASACGTKHFKTLEEMFAFCHHHSVELPDAAIICTPNSSHAALGMMLAEKGIHLLVEKPMAATAADCIALDNFCRASKVKLLIGHHRRFNPYIVKTKENMSKIGNPVAIQGVWALKKHQQYFNEKAWRRSKHSGGGTILINLIHDLDLFQYLLGPIAKVYAEPLPCQRPAEAENDHVDEGVVLTVRFANGCCGTFLCSDNVISPFSFEVGTGENPLIPHRQDVAGVYRIFGSKGTISVPDLTFYHQNNLSETQKSWWEPVCSEKLNSDFEEARPSLEEASLTPPSSWEANTPIFGSNPKEMPQPFDLQLEHFINLITGAESEVKCSGLDALSSLLCIEAVKKSIETGLAQAVEQATDLLKST